jgi:hypothetical protein
MPAYFGPWRVVSAQPVPPQVLGLARKLVGGMLQVGGIPKRQWRLDDGTTIHALIVNGVPKVTITQPVSAANPQSAPAELWLPRGFVVTPASSAAPRGAGLPVVQQGDNAYTAANLNPGLDMTRWTAGGPHGQVLLSLDEDAGYPLTFVQAAPVHYSLGGPSATLPAGYDSRPTAPGATWQAYRPRYADFVSHYDTDPAQARRALFDAVDAYRSDSVVARAYLMPRGFYRPAEVLSYLMTAGGLAQGGYPRGYRTTAERLAKDGPWSDHVAAELVAVGGTPAQVIESWQAGHAADVLLQPADHTPVFADVGYSAGNWVLTTQPRDHWIMAGRRSFQSSDAQLPPISWDGPPALNLGWTTFPITFHDRSIWSPPPLVMDGKFWLSYANSTYGSRPAIGPNVYCRGRVLGTVPSGGFVLGAGVSVVVEESDDQPAADRLLAIAYHPAENDTLDMATQGVMAVAHVWYADFPRTGGLRLHAEAPVTEVFDPEAPEPAAGLVQWRDGGMLTLPGIKYESFWEFAPDGSKACCLRDAVSVGEILDYFSGRFPGGNGYGWYSGAFKGVLCEVAITAQPAFNPSTTALTTKSYLARGLTDQFNYRPGLYPSNPPEAPADAWAAEDQLVPLAAGYVNGAARIAYHGFASLLENATDPRTNPPALGGDGKYWYAAFGGTALVYPSESDSAVVMARGVLGSADGYAWPAAPVPLIADIAQQVVIADLDTAAAKLVSYTLSGGLYTYAYASNADFPVDVLDTTAAVRRVRVYQMGQLLHEATYTHPYGVLWATDRIFLPQVDGGGAFTASPLDPTHPFNPDTDSWAIFPAAPDLTLQPVFARRCAEHVIGYQVGLATPITTLAFGALTNPTMTDYAAAYRINLTQTIAAEDRPVLGGWFTTTFDAPDTGGEWLAEAMTC